MNPGAPLAGGLLLAATLTAVSDPAALWIVTGCSILGFGVCGGLLGATLIFAATRSLRAWKLWLPILLVVFALIGVTVAYAFLWNP